MVKDYIIVDFLKLDPKLFYLLPERENGFGGYSVGVLYCGKKLYVRYGKRQCSRGVIRWDNGGYPSYTVSIRLGEVDKYVDKADELDSFFREEFGPRWCDILRGETVSIMDFKLILMDNFTETKFFVNGFGRDISVAAEDCIPRMSNIRVLALWDNVSIGSMYGVVVRPKAVQIMVLDVPDFEDYDCYYVDFPVVYGECCMEEEYC